MVGARRGPAGRIYATDYFGNYNPETGTGSGRIKVYDESLAMSGEEVTTFAGGNQICDEAQRIVAIVHSDVWRPENHDRADVDGAGDSMRRRHERWSIWNGSEYVDSPMQVQGYEFAIVNEKRPSVCNRA